MNIQQLSKHLASVTSEKKMHFLLREFQSRTSGNAINFILSLRNKRKALVAKRLKKQWLGNKDDQGILQQIRSKYSLNNN